MNSTFNRFNKKQFIIRTMIKSTVFLLLFTTLFSCNGTTFNTSANNDSSTLTIGSLSSTFNDTIGFWGKESSLYNEIILSLPFGVDSSHLVGRICGNEPKCYLYYNFSNNLEVEICQSAQTIKDYIAPRNVDQLSSDRIAKVNNSIGRNAYINNTKPAQKMFGSDSITSIDNSKWLIGGIEFLLNEKNNTMMVNCVNTKTDYTEFFIYTNIGLKYNKSKQTKEDAIDLAKFICQHVSSGKK